MFEVFIDIPFENGLRITFYWW